MANIKKKGLQISNVFELVFMLWVFMSFLNKPIQLFDINVN